MSANRQTGFTIPTPPTANTIWRKGKDGRIYRNKKYMDWLEAAGKEIMAQKPVKLRNIERIEVRVYMVRPRKNADIDNRIKPILDLMEHTQLIQNDKLVHKVSAEWIPKKPNLSECFVFYEGMKDEC